MKKRSKLPPALEMAGLTDAGLIRDHNEDAISFDADLGFIVLADGMGGYSAGEVASSITVEEITKILRDTMVGSPLHASYPGSPWPLAHHVLRTAVEQANAAVYATAQRDVRFQGMGTTVVAGIFYNNRLLLAHVGDSRAYRFRGGALTQLTRDHSLVQEQLDAGLISEIEAQESEFKNLVTRAIGVESSVLVEIQEYPVAVGDVFLFCSDGLTDMLDPATIGELLAESETGVLSVACSLVEHANIAGGRDNVSVVLCKVRRDFGADHSLLARLASWLK